MLRWLRSRLFRTDPRPPTELSRLIVGSTGNGKSEGEMVELVRLARRREYAVVLLDGHGPLAFRTAGHWVASGHEPRLVYEPLRATDRVLCWNMLPKSMALSLPERRLEDAETRDEVAQCFMAQRNIGSLNDRPATKEWLEAAITLCLSQPREEPLPSLLSPFRVGSPEYERLLRDSDEPGLVAKFRDAERLRRKNEAQYELQTGASRRLLEVVCASEVVRLRSRMGPFHWLEALRQRRLVVLDGGGIRSGELKRTLFLLASMQVLHAVRRHFSERQEPLPVVLVLEEAGALDLVTPFVLNALRELRKAGLALHVITQSCLDFGDQRLFESLLANMPSQLFYQALSPADQELGARVLANATFDPLSVHYTRTRTLYDGTQAAQTVSRGRVFDEEGDAVRHDVRKGEALRPRYRAREEPYYKSPQLHEQEYRTKLATLRVGERFVRDRSGVRCERVRALRPHRPRHAFDTNTDAAIARIRSQPLYLPAPSSAEPAPPPLILPDAADILRERLAESC